MGGHVRGGSSTALSYGAMHGEKQKDTPALTVFALEVESERARSFMKV